MEPKIAHAAAELSRCLWKTSVAIASIAFVSILKNVPHAFARRTPAVFASKGSRAASRETDPKMAPRSPRESLPTAVISVSEQQVSAG